MDYVFYRTLFRKTVTNSYVDHVVLPSLNLFHKEFVQSSDFGISVPIQEQIGYTFQPYNVLIAGAELDDLSDKLVQDKMVWLKKLKRLQPKDVKKSLQELKKFEKDKDSKLSLRLRRYVDHVERDPIAGFEGSRNWLYSGGTFTPHPHREEDLLTLVAASGDNLSSISKVMINEDGTLNCDFRTKLKMNSPILQIITDPTSSLIGVRQQNNFTVLKPDCDDFIVVRKKKIRNANYFTSAAMKDGKVALAKNAGDAVIFDAENNNVGFQKTLHDSRRCSMKNNWCQLHWKNNQLLCVIRKKLGILDPRGGEQSWNVSNVFEECENICNYFESESCSYLASTHHLYQLDFRNQKFLRRWTHLMTAPPHLGQAIKINDDELVIVQSSLPSDAVVVNNSINAMHVPPRGLLSPIDALRQVQLEGQCLDPEVAKRTAYTITGTYLCQDKNKVRQLTQNAGGDIYIRAITKEDGSGMDVDEKIDVDSWQNYEDTAPIGSKAHCSSIVDMTNTFERLKIPKENLKSFHQPGETIWALEEQTIPERLHKYKDVLAEPILDLWNVEPFESEEEKEEVLGVDDDLTSELKVAEWLMKHS